MQNLAVSSQPDQLPELIGDWLQQHAQISADECQHIFNLWHEQQEELRLPHLLLKLGTVSAGDLSQCMADLYKLPQLDLHQYPETPICGEQLSASFLQRHRILPVQESDENLTLAMTDPSDDLAVQSVELACHKQVERCIANDTDLQQIYDCFYGDGSSALGQIIDGFEEENPADIDIDQLRDMASEAPVIRLVNVLIRNACDKNASDIHIEPFEHNLKVRLRCDGILQEIEAPPPHMAAAVISRIKIMANLDIAERRVPQDGRINMKVQGSNIDIRVSTVPGVHGECVVMRLLRRDKLVLDFKALGFTGGDQRQIQEILDLPNGLVIVSGPTGSGKSTTLYTALSQLNKPARKIITVEDPVEYKLEGINQIQVNNTIGLTFASALRAIVRQDPDVIMVGEMRDLEAARICVQSALTGHLVLSTLHTNEAASCITRLLEMGVEDYLLTSTLVAAVGQRLVRRLCPHCAEPYEPLPELAQSIRQQNHLDPHAEITLYQPVGCDHCENKGFRGRLAIVEILPVSDRIRQLILQHADAMTIQHAAMEEGMQSLYFDGCRKALAGQTTFEEVLRVTQEG